MKIFTNNRGFTLVEMAIVLVILGFVLTSLFLPLRAQREQANLLQTRNTLEIAKQALLGFAQSQGRIPCPATATSNGIESTVAAGCTQQWGFLPAATLGITPVDSNGFALDAWNNRILYAVTQVNTAGGATTPDFTTAGEMANVGIANLAPNLRVCATSVVAGCTATINLTNNAVAVIYSIGATGAQGSAGKADELENLNAIGNVDTVFVSHEINATTDANEFDHIVTWVSPFTLYNAMIQAGQLH